MIGPIERFRRLGQIGRVAPVMMLVVGIPSHPDPTKRLTGTAGILPIPAAPATTAGRSDAPAAESRRDTRSERGRVLFADGRVLRLSRISRDSAHAMHRHLCPDQRVVQTRGSANPSS